MNTDKINAFLEGYYLGKNEYPKAISVPVIDYVRLEMETLYRSMPQKPEPPRYNAGYQTQEGFLSSGYGESYVYNFNDPLYLEALSKYKRDMEEWRSRDNKKLSYLTAFGEVEIMQGTFNQTEIFAIE